MKFTKLQFVFRCYAVVAILSFTVEKLLLIPALSTWYYDIVTKLEWHNYGMWFWHLIGTLSTLVWQISYDYKISRRAKERKQLTEIFKD